MHPGQADLLMAVQYAVERKVVPTLVPGLQLDDLARTTRWQVQVDPRVVIVGRTEVQADDGGDGVEQADQVKADIHRGVEAGLQAEATSLQQFAEQSTARFEQLVGAMPRSGGATTEAKDVELDTAN